MASRLGLLGYFLTHSRLLLVVRSRILRLRLSVLSGLLWLLWWSFLLIILHLGGALHY